MDFEGFGTGQNPHLKNFAEELTCCLSMCNNAFGLSRGVHVNSELMQNDYFRTMKHIIFILAATALTIASAVRAWAQSPDYDAWFTSDRLRVDFVLAGNADSQQAYLSGLRKECAWAGSHESLIDPFRYGEYMFEVRTVDGDTLIYSKGFSTLFQEWRTTPEARVVSKAYNQSVWMPFPKKEVRITLSERMKEACGTGRTGRFREIFSCTVDPDDVLVCREAPAEDYAVTPLLVSGAMEHKVDLLFVAEGYTAQQMDKFHRDCRKFMEYLFSMEPYKSRMDDFNVTAVDVISPEQGTDIPDQGIWKHTALNSHFYTFYIDRYLTVTDYKAIADNVAGVPFDVIFIVVNEEKYGGGIYNSYALGTAGNELSYQVFVHEFGHSFASLGDEYFTSEAAYENFYISDIEPWEPNITTMADFGSKWKDMMDSGKWDEAQVGIHEGGGYMAKGVYRSREDCRMRTNTAPDFCPVCQRAINRMIDYYCK